jgi:hemoglobin
MSRVPSVPLPVTEPIGTPHADAEGISEAHIRDVVDEFYRRVLLDDRIGPIFDALIRDWDEHLARMADFWSAALLRTGRYSGNPLERHRALGGLEAGHFGRWLDLFEATAHDLCPPGHAEAFIVRARRMRAAMTKILA